MENKKLFENLKKHLLIKGNSISTINTYWSHVRQFLCYIYNVVGVDIGDISNIPTTPNIKNILEEYILHRKSLKKENTLTNDISAINCLIEYWKLDIEPFCHQKTVDKLPEHIDLSFLEDETIPLVDEESFKDYLRVKAILYLLFFTGIRQNEIINLKRKDFDLEARTVKIVDKKRKKERIVFFTAKVAEIIKDYFDKESERKNAFNINKKMIEYRFKKLNHLKSFEIKLHPHLFRHCVSEDTECLTEQGWKKYNELTKKDKLFTYNLETNQIELNNLIKIWKYDYQGLMYNIKNYYLDCLVSPEHNNIFQLAYIKQENFKRWTEWNTWKLYTIKELFNTPNKRLINGLVGAISNGDLSIGIAKAGLLGWIMTDGHISKRGDITISQSLTANHKNCIIIENLLINSKLSYTKKIQKEQINIYNKKKYQMVIFRILKSDTLWIYEWLTQNNYPKWKLLQLKQEELQSIFDNMMLADGTKRGNEFCDQDKKKIDFFRILASFLGYRTNLDTTNCEHKFRTYITYKNYANIQLNHIKKLEYKGIIWCPMTKNKTFIAKRNDKIFITGNSFAVYCLEQGIDLPTVSQLLGHSNIQTTMIYARKMPNKLKEIYDKHIK